MALEEIQSVANTTKHGAKRLLERGFTPSEINALQSIPDMVYMQGVDGAKILIKSVGSDKYNVIIKSGNGVVTAIKNLGEQALKKLAENYQWR